MPLALFLLLSVLRIARPFAAGESSRADPALSDEDLYRRYAEGERGAFRMLVARYGTPVYRYLVRRLGDDDLAHDVSQEVFLNVVTAAREFRGQSSFRTFLYRILHNAMVTCARSRRRRPEYGALPLDAPSQTGRDDRPLQETLPTAAPGGDAKTQSGELSDALEAGLRKLPDEQRQVFLLRQFEGLDFEEVAAICGITATCARTRMHYAVVALRASLAGFGGLP